MTLPRRIEAFAECSASLAVRGGCRKASGDIRGCVSTAGTLRAGDMSDQQAEGQDKAPKRSGRHDVNQQHFMLVRCNQQADESGDAGRQQGKHANVINQLRENRSPLPVMHEPTFEQEGNHQSRKDLSEETGQIRGHVEEHAAILTTGSDIGSSSWRGSRRTALPRHATARFHGRARCRALPCATATEQTRGTAYATAATAPSRYRSPPSLGGRRR